MKHFIPRYQSLSALSRSQDRPSQPVAHSSERNWLKQFARTLAALLVASPCVTTLAQFDNDDVDLAELPIQELMQIPITSVSRTPEPVARSAAAVYVITQEDIKRSGARSIAEALRMAPGINVARIDANKWAISSRGFNDFFANKLLVLQDGRSVYTPLFSGVFWDVQDTMLDDIERIEVIRGPGATMWGANAVNGVINIITKSAKETQGGLVSAGAGNEELAFGSARYGGRLGEQGYYRAFVKYFNRDDFVDPIDLSPTPPRLGHDSSDEWHVLRGGFRTDWFVTPDDNINLQGEFYAGQIDQELTVPLRTVDFTVFPPTYTRMLIGEGEVSGGHVLSSWKHVFSDQADLALQVYYDRTEREDLVHHEIRDTYDVDFQHRFQVGERQQFIWGLGYRYTEDSLGDGKVGLNALTFDPDERHDHLASMFLQDEIVLVEDRLSLTLGSKFEHNDYTQFEVQPNARMLWTPHEKHTLWSAVSRAVRTPARFEHTADLGYVPVPPATPGLPSPSRLIGSSDFESEKLIAYELGYRVQPWDTVSFDLAGFYNTYRDLRVIEPFGANPPPFPGAPPTILFRPENGMDADTYGAELAATWRVTRSWRLSAAYSWLQIELDTHSNITAVDPNDEEGESPEHQFNVRSYLDLPHDLQFDTILYFVDALPSRNVDSYFRLDLRLGWSPTDNFDISLVAHNVLEDEQREWGPGFLVSPAQVERSFYAKVTWKF